LTSSCVEEGSDAKAGGRSLSLVVEGICFVDPDPASGVFNGDGSFLFCAFRNGGFPSFAGFADGFDDWRANSLGFLRRLYGELIV
jgi:hypothetical protein